MSIDNIGAGNNYLYWYGYGRGSVFTVMLTDGNERE